MGRCIDVSNAASFVAVAILLAVGPALAQVVRTADVNVRGLRENDFPRMVKLTDNIYAYEELANPLTSNAAFTTNSLIVVTRDGVLVADAQGSEAATRKLIAEIGKITARPIKYVVIGADHADHVAGNGVFPDGVTFIAHPNSKAAIERMAASGRGRGGSGGSRAIPIPQELVSDSRVLRMGDTEMHILFLGRAHTGGDLEVYFPREGIMWMSEAFHNRIYPSMGGNLSGQPSEWIEVLKKAEAMNARMYVPNHGFVDSAEILKEEMINLRRALENLVSEGRRLYAAGVPLQIAYRNINLGEFQYWFRAANNMPDGLRKVYAEEEEKKK
jgi:glyoxylase-like metal-dependent hydrolase (beta-lactamase superfamily II)